MGILYALHINSNLMLAQKVNQEKEPQKNCLHKEALFHQLKQLLLMERVKGWSF